MKKSNATLTLNEIKVEGFEKVLEFKESLSGLHAIIAIHNTKMGPALGGTRIHPYATFEEALEDVTRLSSGMTYKSAIAHMGTGGGKSVIIADPNTQKTEALLLAFAAAVNTLEGGYICAEDMGVTGDDLKVIRRGTQYVVGFPDPKSSGDPCPYTAWGVFQGIRATCHGLFGSPSVAGHTFAIQGLGCVGMKVARSLFWQGAKLIVADIDAARCRSAQREFDAQVVSVDEILTTECDVFVPCARGGVLNANSIVQLNCKGVCGAANNQLLTDQDDQRLAERGILYAPDYLVNGGGLINVCAELDEQGYNPAVARDRTAQIYTHLLEVYEQAKKKGRPTNQVSNEMAEFNLMRGIGKRVRPPRFHH